jgi:hypothetical protein
LSGCGKPSAANIELRKENQSLHDRIQDLQTANAALEASVRAQQASATTVPSLPQDRIEQLFTVHGLKISRLSGVIDGVLKIYCVPVDQHGETIKAAGSFEVQAFDLNQPESPLIGTWAFPIEKAGENWYNTLLLRAYVLPCPWQDAQPSGATLTVKVTFTDALTGRAFTQQKEVAAHEKL